MFVNNPGPSATPNIVASFTDGLVDLEEFKESVSEPKPDAEKLADPDGKPIKKKQAKKGTTYKDMQEDVVQISDIKDVVTNPKTWEGTVAGNTRGYGVNQNIAQKAKGGRVNYADR